MHSSCGGRFNFLEARGCMRLCWTGVRSSVAWGDGDVDDIVWRGVMKGGE
jgi:hypothetical protein